MRFSSKLLVVAGVSLLAVLASDANAGANNRCNTFYAADSYIQRANSEQLEIIQHAEPDLPPIQVQKPEQKKQKSSTNFFSWLTNSHTMPSLHFIEFIELFGHEND